MNSRGVWRGKSKQVAFTEETKHMIQPPSFSFFRMARERPRPGTNFHWQPRFVRININRFAKFYQLANGLDYLWGPISCLRCG